MLTVRFSFHIALLTIKHREKHANLPAVIANNNNNNNYIYNAQIAYRCSDAHDNHYSKKLKIDNLRLKLQLPNYTTQK